MRTKIIKLYLSSQLEIYLIIFTKSWEARMSKQSVNSLSVKILLIFSMERGLYREASSSSVRQQLCKFLCNPEVHCPVQNNASFAIIRSHINPLHAFSPSLSMLRITCNSVMIPIYMALSLHLGQPSFFAADQN